MSELAPTHEKSLDSILIRPLSAWVSLDIEKTIYLAFIVLSLLTRLINVGDRVVSHDESLHTQYSYQYYNGDGYIHTPLMHGPTLFHITAVSYWLFGDNDTSARIPVAIAGTILVLLPYFFRSWIGKAGALVASFLLLISPYITYYSRYIRHDIYIIVAAVITFIAIQYYLRENKDKYLWWFAIGMGLMFTTMETSFIYVAILGSFLALRLIARIVTANWFRNQLVAVRWPMLLVGLAIILFLIGFGVQHYVPGVLEEEPATATVTAEEGFAADPEQALGVAEDITEESSAIRFMRWLQVGALLLLSAGLFLTANALRPLIDEFREFDLVVLFTTLTLPMATSFLIVIAGGDPLAYTISKCELAGQETMSEVSLFFTRLLNATCRSAFLSSPAVLSGAFLILMLIVSVLVGIWWNRRRWLISSAIFHTIFLLLFTSFFTNPSGWATGMIGSLGYWLEQQEVQRANQPWYFYFIVLPLYEFLPLIFTFLAAYLWAKRNQLHKFASYWIVVILVGLFGYSISNWLINRNILPTEDMTRTPGLIVAGIILASSLIIWISTQKGRILSEYKQGENESRRLSVEALLGFVPYLLWWFLLSWVIYSLAGEKMAWLSTHFIFPMVILAGWFVNEKLTNGNQYQILSRQFFLLVGVLLGLLIATGLALSPILRGTIRLGDQTTSNLGGIGRFLGILVVAVVIFYIARLISRDLERGTVRRALLVAFFVLLSLLTIRFTYMASFKNADFVTEYLVYAHGAPATKSEVLSQLEQLSLRMHGDKSIKVAFDNDSSWPYTWYLRDYPNRIYFGENPGRNIIEAPVIIVGSQNWGKVEPLVGDDYETRNYTFLWWPMEEYRKLSWNAIFGDRNVDPEARRGLGNPDVRQALWDIFFYRDYQKYGEVFGGDYSIGQWPLRHDLRMYLRKDILATIWDHGIDAIAAEPPIDLYAENELEFAPIGFIGSPGSGQGQLLQPRNVALGPDGLLYIADSGNHRIQVFDRDGQNLRSWGEFGTGPGQFNEPWGLAVDDDAVYVADTWNHRVQKFSHEGEFIAVMGQSGSPVAGEVGGGLFFGPRDIVMLDDGNLLVTDTGNHRMQILDTGGNFLDAVGSQGNLPGQMHEPVGIAKGPDGSIFLADTWNGRIQQFNGDFLPIKEWPVDAWYGESINNKPYLAADQTGRVYVTDPEGYRVIVFNQLGEYIGRFGQYSPDIDGFGLPNGIKVDSDGFVYVADAGNSRILVFPPLDELSPQTVEQ